MKRYTLSCIHVIVPRKIMIAALLFLVCCFFYGPTAHATIPTGTSDLVQFTASGHILGFDAKRMHVASGDHVLRVEFVGTDGVRPVADQMLGGNGHALPLGRVEYPELWPGISLSYEAVPGGIVRSSYLIEPRADVGQIRLRYNTSVEIESGGGLRIGYKSGWMNESAPVAWQEIGGERIPVMVAFSFYDSSIKNSTVGFSLGQYNPAYQLMIDPTLSWNTFMGGADDDKAVAISMDSSGNVYVAGYSTFTWGSPLNPFAGGDADAFIAKLNSSGVLQWNTFIGGTGNDAAAAISMDSDGNVYVAGYSTFTWGSPLNPYTGEGYSDAFVARLNSSGALQWNTFIGGIYFDFAYAISIDGSGNVYVAGDSTFTWGSPLNIFVGMGGMMDAFVARLNSSGELQWNTFMGGTHSDYARGISMDGNGNLYVAGYSYATWGSPLNPFTVSGSDAFVAKLNSSGVLQWNTFMGRAGNDYANAISMDSSENVYIAGSSEATPLYSDTEDAFVAKLNSSGVLQWSSFMGGESADKAAAILMDSSGNVYVAGYSYATWGSPLNPFTVSGNDTFVAKLNSSGVLQWNTFMGGTDYDYASSISMDSSGDVYVAGSSLATWGSPLNPYAGGYDAFVARLSAIDNEEEFPWELFYPAFMKPKP